MTSPVIDDDAFDEYKDAANAIGIGVMQTMDLQDYVMAQVGNVGGPFEEVLLWLFDGVGTVIQDLKDFALTGDSSTLATLAEYVRDKLASIPRMVLDQLGILGDLITGEYEGDDAALLQIQEFFTLLRTLLELVSGVTGGNLPTLAELADGFGDLAAAVGGIIEGIFKVPLWQLDNGGVEVIDSFAALSTVEAGEGWSWDDTAGHDSPGCALYTANGDQGTLTSPNPVQVREGEKYRASAWIKGTAASGGGASLKVQWYDASHKAISSSTVASIGTIISSWIKLEGTVTVPVGARWSRRVFEVNATSGEVRWDDVRFSGTATTIPQQWVENLTEIAQAIFSGWFGGGGGVGTPQEVKYTIESIKQAVINGSIVDTMVVSGNYVVPECTELKAIIIGGGQNGADGQPPDEGSSVKIAAGGLSGGFLAETLDAASLKGKTLSVTIGAPGSPTIIMNGGSEVARCDSGTAGGISVGVEGYTFTTSVPGNGGNGGAGFMKGWASNTPEAASATPGTGSAKGTGGSAGGPSSGGTVGQPGTAGGNVSAGALTKCGGGGGGGGGEGRPLTIADKYDGGAGGPGGYPGGGGGGGGGAAKWLSTAGISGAGGIGAVGVVWFVWR